MPVFLLYPEDEHLGKEVTKAPKKTPSAEALASTKSAVTSDVNVERLELLIAENEVLRSANKTLFAATQAFCAGAGKACTLVGEHYRNLSCESTSREDADGLNRTWSYSQYDQAAGDDGTDVAADLHSRTSPVIAPDDTAAPTSSRRSASVSWAAPAVDHAYRSSELAAQSAKQAIGQYFSCVHCDLVFITVERMLAHTSEVHLKNGPLKRGRPKQGSMSNVKFKEDPPKKQYQSLHKCEICEVTYTTQQELQAHELMCYTRLVREVEAEMEVKRRAVEAGHKWPEAALAIGATVPGDERSVDDSYTDEERFEDAAAIEWEEEIRRVEEQLQLYAPKANSIASCSKPPPYSHTF